MLNYVLDSAHVSGGWLALAAVGSTTSMVNFYVLAITGFTLGLSILFAQKFGARELEDIRRILSTFLWR